MNRINRKDIRDFLEISSDINLNNPNSNSLNSISKKQGIPDPTFLTFSVVFDFEDELRPDGRSKNSNLLTPESHIDSAINYLLRINRPENAGYLREFREQLKNVQENKPGENACKKKFEKMLFDEYNIEYKIKTSNTSDDISGLDGEFDFNGIPVTLQIKPFTKSIKKNGKIIVYSNGAMNFNTNYLLLYRETSVKGKYYRYDYIFLKNGKNFDKISYDNGRYETSVDYIIYP
jgi:hypothetical protein